MLLRGLQQEHVGDWAVIGRWFDALQDIIQVMGEPRNHDKNSAGWSCGCGAMHVDMPPETRWILAATCPKHRDLMPPQPDNALQHQFLSSIVDRVMEECDATVDWSPIGDSVSFTLGSCSTVITADYGGKSDESLDTLVRLIVLELIANQ